MDGGRTVESLQAVGHSPTRSIFQSKSDEESGGVKTMVDRIKNIGFFI